MTIEDCRRFFAHEIRFAAGLGADNPLVEAFARVPREDYLGPPPWHIIELSGVPGKRAPMPVMTEDARDLYHNVLVAIDFSQKLNNGQPGSLALWMAALDLKPGARVYHLGCGVGYYTAMMAEVVGGPGKVIGVEIRTDLAERSRKNLARYTQVEIQAGDGSDIAAGAFDAIFINAGATHFLPRWLDALAEGGRLVAPLTLGNGRGVVAKVVRAGERYSAQMVSPVAIFPCANARDAGAQTQLAEAFKGDKISKMACVRRDEHERCERCLVHVPGACLSLG